MPITELLVMFYAVSALRRYTGQRFPTRDFASFFPCFFSMFYPNKRCRAIYPTPSLFIILCCFFVQNRRTFQKARLLLYLPKILALLSGNTTQRTWPLIILRSSAPTIGLRLSLLLLRLSPITK